MPTPHPSMARLTHRCQSCGKELPGMPGDESMPDGISHGSCDACTSAEMAKLDAISVNTLRRFWHHYLTTVPDPQRANVEELLERVQHDAEAKLSLEDLEQSRGLQYVIDLAERVLSSRRRGSAVMPKQVPKLFVASAEVVAAVFGLRTAAKETVGFSYENQHWVVSYRGQRVVSPLRTSEVYAIYRSSIRREDLDTSLDLTEEQIEKMPAEEFYDLTAVVIDELDHLGGKVKDLEEVFKRLRAARLLRLLGEYKGKVVQIRTAVLQLGESKPATPYKEVLEALVEARPELSTLVQELTEAKLKLKVPTPSIQKHLLPKEPGTWKKLPHETLGALPSAQVDVRAIESLLRDHLTRLDSILSALNSGLYHVATLALAESDLSAEEKLSALTAAIKQLQAVDFGQGPVGGIPLLEKARELVLAADVEPADIEQAIRTWADNPDQAQGFIHGPSNRGSGKGALADLLELIEKLKQGSET